ncbi:MAG: hypothetical protein UX16_C0001G0004 [Parcubacteria group bacterium GW2011_GWB1_45_7]|uniref:Uncharacterized protein n=2 Tax=environmental samples TaxID=221217 RepID=A0A0H4TF19_9BACT|nr:hypothetical protein [uncultured Parcubacteria bacterium Rifle_16ft_4_minimus_37647]AKQ05620.1 hypothetical protein [uncultured Parcubacteria bacterium Rifle_16ft_4_minimus_23790]KKU11908.1 MAG: hypothetical protein UX16_C0001G0004 [Parcubacteria group bacterium GW2011_GWB1_45_7]
MKNIPQVLSLGIMERTEGEENPAAGAGLFWF